MNKNSNFSLQKIGTYIIIIGLLLILIGLNIEILVYSMRLYARSMLVVGAVLTIVSVFFLRESILSLIRSRTTQYSSNAILMILLFLGILGIINYIAYRRDFRFDLTSAKEYSLSPQSIKVIKNLKSPVTIRAFFTTNDSKLSELKSRMNEYIHKSNKLKVEYIDPDKDPGTTASYDVRSYGTIILECEGRTERIYDIDEQKITSAILRISKGEKKKIYFLDGHNERSITDFEKSGYSNFKEVLESENYLVEKLYLSKNPVVPEDCNVLVIAGPEKPLLDKEIEVINNYILSGGKALILVEPHPAPDLHEILFRWGIREDSTLVVDIDSHFWTDVASPMISNYSWHPITKKLSSTFFPRARAINTIKAMPDPDITLQGIAQTSEKSWGETSREKAEFNEGKDVKGPMNLIAIVTSKIKAKQDTTKQIKKDDETKMTGEKKTRMIIIGDADFASNAFIGMLGNYDLAINSINWLAEEEELIEIHAKKPVDRKVYLSNLEINAIFAIIVIDIPAFILFLGGVVWWRRR